MEDLTSKLRAEISKKGLTPAEIGAGAGDVLLSTASRLAAYLKLTLTKDTDAS